MSRQRLAADRVLAAYPRALATLSRRQLLKIVGMAGAAAIAEPIVSSGLLAQPFFGDYPFTLGVASGDPLPTGIVLWTRLAPRPLEGGGMPMREVEVRWEIAQDDRFRAVVQRGATLARLNWGIACTWRWTVSSPATITSTGSLPGPR